MKFSNHEKKDLTIAAFMISLAFAILLSGGYSALENINRFIIFAFIFSFFTAGLGFLLHEIMHKYVAQSYGLWAEFRASYGMLWLAILFSFFGFIFAAPGAVYIHGLITNERNGKISIAGPITNIVLAFLFLIPLLLVKLSILDFGQIFTIFLNYGLTINSLLASFNMIPVMPLDGAKVIAWSKKAYFITLITSVTLFIISFFI